VLILTLVLNTVLAFSSWKVVLNIGMLLIALYVVGVSSVSRNVAFNAEKKMVRQRTIK
jgi:hypothetical protein